MRSAGSLLNLAITVRRRDHSPCALRSDRFVGSADKEVMTHTRRQVLGGAAAASVALGAPSVIALEARRIIRFVPHADLRIVDPVWTTAYVTRNHGYLVYDTLFGTDANHQIKPQMVENTTISPNGMKYTFALRDGLEWAQDARLLRAAKGRLLPTRRATALLELSGTSDLFRTMFETAFWRINLAYFDRLPIEHWPQTHIGVVLWSLSVAAHKIAVTTAHRD